MRRALLLSLPLALLGVLALEASAEPLVVDTPRGRVSGPAYLAATFDRLADQLQHEDYQSRVDAERVSCPADNHCADADPYVAEWTREHLRTERGQLPGTKVAYELLLPKAGVRSPVDGRPLKAPYPAVVLLPGGGTAKEVYRGMAQGLAATGYAVLSVDPECNRDPASCATPLPPDQQAVATAGEAVGLATLVGSIVGSCVATGCDYTALQEGYAASEATYQAAGRAALSFLASRPALVDRHRVGVVGHSLGAYNAALLAQQPGLPAKVRAAVAWDGYGIVRDEVTPRVPVQFQVYEGQDLTPHAFRPDESPSHDNAARWQSSRVATGVVALRSSAHYEVGHIAYDNAVTNAKGASRKGERVALDSTLAWLDLHLGTGQPSTRLEALTGPRIGSAVDAVAHGQGTEAADGSNVPYTIGGDLRTDHLSLLMRSWYDLTGGRACSDVVAGCPSSPARR